MRRYVFAIVALAVILSVCGIAWQMLEWFGGRSASRLGGRDHAQELVLENLSSPSHVISISFDKRGSNTVKDVTYRATDGYVYTREFVDASAFEGVIRWVPKGQEASFVQSRAISRWGGGAVNLELPEDCLQVLNVDIGYASKNERVKNLVYRSTDGQVWSKEYQEGMIERHLSGWMKISAKGGDR